MSLLSISSAKSYQYKWYHGVLFFFAVHIISAPWIQTPEFFNTQIKAPFAPPSWVFAPIWIINTILMVWAGMVILNKTEHSTDRQTLITLQLISWLCFVTFGWLYFGLHSPLLGALVTLAMFGVNLASVVIGFRLDKRFSYALMPLMVWLTAASVLAIYQALYNYDELLHLNPLIK